MNVGQLISELNKYDHDLKIYCYEHTDEGIYCDIVGLKNIRIRDNKVLHWCKNYKPFLKDTDETALEVLLSDDCLDGTFLCSKEDGVVINEN